MVYNDRAMEPQNDVGDNVVASQPLLASNHAVVGNVAPAPVEEVSLSQLRHTDTVCVSSLLSSLSPTLL